MCVAAQVCVTMVLLVSMVQAGRPGGVHQCPSGQCTCQQNQRHGVHVDCTSHTGHIPEFTVTGVTYWTLSLVSSNITRLPKNSFQAVSVRVLELTGNPLWRGGVHTKAFVGLDNVTEVMVMNECGLQEIPSRSLARLRRLESLRISSNNIKSIESGVLRHNKRLTELHLYKNHLTRLHKRAFQSLSRLENLKLFGNLLTALPGGLFRGLRHLVNLDLSANQLSDLPSRLFKGLDKLTWLELANNQLKYLSKDVFKGLRGLRYLRLDGNPLMSVAPGALGPPRNLTHLNLDVGNITELSVDVFKGLRSIEWLSLGDVSRASLPSGLLGDMARLKFLLLFDPSRVLRDVPLDVFSSSLDFFQLILQVEPLSDCHCNTHWVVEVTGKGASVQGHCAQSQAVKCSPGRYLGNMRHSTGRNVGGKKRRRKKKRKHRDNKRPNLL